MSATTTAVKERPILFSGPMVRAILEGRKTQTRRAIATDWWRCLDPEDDDDRASAIPQCPYGQPGERLWVREGARQLGHERTGRNGQYLWPKFDDPEKGRRWFDQSCYYTADYKGEYEDEPQGTLNKLFMPRWASRLTLEITRVRVERLQDISAEDAVAEGLSRLTKDGGRLWKFGIPDSDGLPGRDDFGWHWAEWHVDPRVAFRALWDSIIAQRGPAWATNPWVWAIDFRRIEP